MNPHLKNINHRCNLCVVGGGLAGLRPVHVPQTLVKDLQLEIPDSAGDYKMVAQVTGNHQRMGNYGNGQFWDHCNHQRIGVAVADHPEGPFVKYGKSIMVTPENSWSVEDCFIWFEDGMYYALAKDFHG